MDTFWKNKKVAAYIALKHHTRFIIPIMERLAELGAVTQYIVGQAERSQEITAIETGLDYNHVFDYLTPSDHDDILNIYEMLRNGFGESLLKNTAFSLVVPTVMDKSLFGTAQEYMGFKNFLKTHKPDVCIALHEVNRWGKMFSYHAKLAHIPCITLQEGLLTTATAEKNYIFTGHVQYSALSLVWGEGTKEKLSTYEAPEERLISVGNTHLADEIQRVKRTGIRAKKREQYASKGSVSLLLLSVFLHPLDELLPLFESFYEDPENQFFVKFHPASVKLQIDKWLEPLTPEIRDAIHFIHGEESTYDLMAMSDLCILVEGSTTGLEALAMGKPVVELNLETPVYHAFSLSDQEAGIPLTPTELVTKIRNRTDFKKQMNNKKIKEYLNFELCELENATENVIDTMKKAISAGKDADLPELSPEKSLNLEWSIVLPVTNTPALFLDILETISLFSQNEEYEVILIKPGRVSSDIAAILDSLEGDVSQIEVQKDQSPLEVMNKAALKARGDKLIFMEKNLAPTKGWLEAMKNGMSKFDKEKIFGARIINKYNNIVHAGMVVNVNNSPVSAYLHVDKNFPHVLKDRSFQMVNHFICMDRNFFFKTGGFNPKAGVYAYLDLCLRAAKITQKKETVQYLSQAKLAQDAPAVTKIPRDDSIFFFCRWHGNLWENEDALYKKDGVSSIQLDGARMTRAIETASYR